MIQVFNDGPGPMISGVCRSIGLTQTLDHLLKWDDRQCNLSPGLRLEALIIDTLTCRRPLYKIDQTFDRMDVSKMFGPGITAEDINDDSIGRALDKLAEADPREVYGTIALTAVCKEGVSVDVLHADTTSVCVQGVYENGSDADSLRITFGHSKDKRPDLKQFMYGLAVTSDRIPVIGEVMDGNTSDHKWNHELISRLSSLVKDVKRIIYVADSSLVSGPNLKKMAQHGVKFISRLPASFGIESELKQRAWEDGRWQHIGKLSERKDAACYDLTSYKHNLEGSAYRFIVVHSSKLDGRKQNSIERYLSKAETEIGKQIKSLSRREFACEPDAHEAWCEFFKQNAHECFNLEYEVLCEQRRKPRNRRGRPARDEVVETESVFSIHAGMSRDEHAISTLKSRASCFVLITNVAPKELSDEQVLREYKNQSAVEQQFTFIKNPRTVGPVYLKKPERVNALAYVFLMALLVYSIIQRRVRLALKQSGETVEVYDKRQSSEPTAMSILEHFTNVSIALVNGERHLPQRMKHVKKLLRLLGLSEQVYLNWNPP